jgi:hypothetical protein
MNIVVHGVPLRARNFDQSGDPELYQPVGRPVIIWRPDVVVPFVQGIAKDLAFDGADRQQSIDDDTIISGNAPFRWELGSAFSQQPDPRPKPPLSLMLTGPPHCGTDGTADRRSLAPREPAPFSPPNGHDFCTFRVQTPARMA